MKNNKKTGIIVIVNIIMIGAIFIFITTNKNITKEKQVIKEMSESTQVSNLQTQINTLNKEHTDYANYIQTSKRKIANAITEMGVETSENATAETMASNIKNIQNKNDYKKVELFVENYTCDHMNKKPSTGSSYGITMVHTFDTTSLDSYSSLNTENFIVEIVAHSAGTNAKQSVSLNIQKNYDAENGKLEISNLAHAWNQQTNNGFCLVTTTINIWVVR